MTAAAGRRLLWRTVFRCTGGIEVRGALPSGGCVVVANHSSHADAPALLAALDAAHRPMVAAAADYWFCRPAKARICRSLVGGFPVRRAGGGYADLAAREAELRSGRAVVVFPAGSRRSVDGRFRSGAFRLAQDAGVPVVAVRVTGTAAMLPPSGRLRRAPVTVEILPPATATDPHELAGASKDLLARPSAADGSAADDGLPAGSGTPSPNDPPASVGGLPARIARVGAAPAGAVLAFCWAAAEAISWPVVAELLIAALVLSGPARPYRTAIRLALWATLGSAVGGVLTLVLARQGMLLPQPLTTPAMHEYAQQQLAQRGSAGLWSQPVSGVPYKVYARAAGQDAIGVPEWVATSVVVRSVRMTGLALAAALVQRLTRRWQRYYTAAVAAGLLTFVVGLCLIVTRWSQV